MEHICDQDFSTLESPCKIIINEETSNKSRCAEFEIKKLLVDKEVEVLKTLYLKIRQDGQMLKQLR